MREDVRVLSLSAGALLAAIAGLVMMLLSACQPMPRAVPYRGDRVDEWGRPVPAPAYTNAPWAPATGEVFRAGV